MLIQHSICQVWFVDPAIVAAAAGGGGGAAATGGMSLGAKAGIGALVGGTVIQAAAQARAGKEEEELRKANAAIIAAEAEREARAEGEKAGLKRSEKARLAAIQNVQFAKSGIKGGTGTALLQRQESLRRIELQAEVLQEGGLFARDVGMSRSALEIAKGKSARRSGRLQAIGSLATGFGTAGLLGYKT